MSPDAFWDLRDRRSVGRRARRNDASNREKRKREEPREVDETENVTGNVRAVARLELRLSRNEGWRRMRIGMVQLRRTRGKRGTGRECQKTRRPFPVDGWNRTSPMASISVDALYPRYNDDVPRRELLLATDRIV